MCLDCGCMKPDDDHGDERHIVMAELKRAAESDQKSIDETLRTINETARGVMEGRLESEAMGARR